MASKSLRLILSLVLLVFATSFAPRGSDGADLNQLIQNISQGKGVASLQGTMQCMQKLIPCKPYVKGAASNPPPAACCDPLKEVITAEADCLCQFSDDATVLDSLNVTKDDALKLPKACGFDANVSKCKQKEKGSGAATGDGVNIGDVPAKEEASKTDSSGSIENTTPYKIIHFGIVVSMAVFMIFPLVSV